MEQRVLKFLTGDNTTKIHKRLPSFLEDVNKQAPSVPTIGSNTNPSAALFTLRDFIEQLEKLLSASLNDKNSWKQTGDVVDEILKALEDELQPSVQGEKKSLLFQLFMASFQDLSATTIRLKDISLALHLRAVEKMDLEKESLLRNNIVDTLCEKVQASAAPSSTEGRFLLTSKSLEELCKDSIGLDALLLARKAYYGYQPKECARQLRLAIACVNSHPQLTQKSHQQLATLISSLRHTQVDRLEWEIKCLITPRFGLNLFDSNVSLSLLCSAAYDAYTITYG